MRTVKELLQVMLDKQNLFKHGLCSWVDTMYWHDIIDEDERFRISRYIHRHKPAVSGDYWFPNGELAPRIEWINEQIKNLE